MFFSKIKKIQSALLSQGYTQIKWLFSEPNEGHTDSIDRYHVRDDEFIETKLSVNLAGDLIECQEWARIASQEGEEVILDFLESDNATIDALIQEKKQIIPLFYSRDFKD